MKSSGITLTQEIERVVTSPYPTQLKTLHDITLQSSKRDIQQWTELHPCQIFDLCQILIDALPAWPHVSTIITRLAASRAIRDAILEVMPCILDTVIAKIGDGQSGGQRFKELSLALLSFELPQSVALPASAQKFLIQLFESAAAQPDVSTLQPIYRVVNGACRRLVGILPYTVLSELEERLMSIMRTLAPVKDKTPALYCLSVMKSIVDQLAHGLSPDQQAVGWQDMSSSFGDSDVPWKPENLSRLFHGSRAQRTLSLLTLQLIWACTPSIEQAEPEAAAASATMANDILGAIGVDERREWCKQNSQVLRKLHDRCQLVELSATLRFRALVFLSLIYQDMPLSSIFVSAYGDSLLYLNDLGLSSHEIHVDLRLSLPSFVQALDTQFWSTIISNVLELLTDPRSSENSGAMSTFSSLLGHLTECLEQYRPCRQRLQSALSTNKSQEMLDRFLADPIEGVISAETTVHCARVVGLGLNALSSSFCTMLLRSALASQESELQLPAKMVPAILRKHLAAGRSPPVCTSCKKRPKQICHETLLVEVESTPDAEATTLPWRERLSNMMNAQAHANQQAMLSSISGICRDLEQRCQVAEEPLLRERERADALQSRVDQIGQAYGELEAQIMDRDLRINVLEAESDSTVGQLEKSSRNCEKLMDQLEEATKELNRSVDNARATHAAATEKQERLEMEHATILACKQEKLDRVHEELQMLDQELQSLKSEKERLESNEKQNGVQQEQQSFSIKRLEEEVRRQQDLVTRLEKDHANSLEEARKELQHKLADADNVRRDLERQQSLLNAELLDIKEESKRNMERLKSSFEDVQAEAKREWLRIKSNLEQQLEENRTALEETERGLLEQQQSYKHRIAELKQRIERLTKDCHKKDAQIVEAQEMRNRLMSAMGLAATMPAMNITEPSTKSSTLPYRSASIAATPRQPSHQVMSTPAHDDRDIDIDEEEVDRLYLSDASSDHGPTPKRSKPRQMVELVGKSQQPQSAGRRSVKSVLRTRSASKRQPLLGLDSNQSPSKGGRSPSKVAFKDVERDVISTAERRDIEEWSFNATEVITGTPGAGLRGGFNDLEEDSTADV